jgi:hypothetical protein
VECIPTIHGVWVLRIQIHQNPKRTTNEIAIGPFRSRNITQIDTGPLGPRKIVGMNIQEEEIRLAVSVKPRKMTHIWTNCSRQFF